MSARRVTLLLGIILLGGAPLGCAVSPGEQEAARQNWAERDEARWGECQRTRGTCTFGQ